MKKSIQMIIDESKQSFGENLLCILLLGSVQKEDATPFSDVDLVGVLNKYDMQGVRSLRRIILDLSLLVDYSIIALDEISRDPNRFRVGSHGCYQLELVYKQAECIYGKNIFLSFPAPCKRFLKESIFQKISEYVWWMRRIYIEANRERSVYSNYQLNSRLIKMFGDLCFLAGIDNINISCEKIAYMFLENFSGILSKEEEAMVLNLVDKSKTNENAGNMSESYLFQRVNIANKIFSQALKYM